MKSPLVIFYCFNFSLISEIQSDTEWNFMATSSYYINVRLIMESENPFTTQNFSTGKHVRLFKANFSPGNRLEAVIADLMSIKGTSITTAILNCAMACQYNSTCQVFNFYATDTNYECQLLAENFCLQTRRVALQVWPGGRVWDKLRPGETKACLDQKLGKHLESLCEIGRPGCRSSVTSSTATLLDCNKCVQTCLDCQPFYNMSRVNFNCTFWPEGASQSPIFGYCFGNATFIAKKTVNLTPGLVWPHYRMKPRDMHRISRLNAHKTFGICVNSLSLNIAYLANYDNFFIDADETLMNMSYVSGKGGDGFHLNGQPMKPSPWIEIESSCGSFWLLNSSLSSATMQCPGGDISIFGNVNINVSPKQTGIRWPNATVNQQILDYAEIKLK